MINLTETAKKLKTIGLGRDEALVYGYLLEHGAAKSLPIQRATGLTKPLAYRALHALAERGLVTQTKKPGAVTEFSPADPRNIEEHFTQEARTLQQNRSVFESMLPDFLGQFMSHIDRPTMRYEEGVDGVVRIFSESFRAKGTTYQYMDPEVLAAKFGDITKRLTQERKEYRAPKVLLYPNTPYVQSLDLEKLQDAVTQVFMINLPAYPVVIQAYDDTVVLISIKENTITATQTVDGNLANFIKGLLSSLVGLIPG